jgi:hypothetical protein
VYTEVMELRTMAELLKGADAFYARPDELRALALRSAYHTVTGSYGFRSPTGVLPPGTLAKIRTAFGFTNIKLLPEALGTRCFYHSFQRGASRESFYAHTDAVCRAGSVYYSLIVYLTPDAPRQSGTGVFRHKATGIWQDPTTADARRLGLSRAELRTHLEADAKRRDRWDLLDGAENVYNRAVLFPSHWYHSGLNYFGDCLENGRLYQAFFFRATPDVFAALPAPTVPQ